METLLKKANEEKLPKQVVNLVKLLCRSWFCV